MPHRPSPPLFRRAGICARLLAVIVVVGPGGASAQPAPLTLGEAVRQALARDQAIAASTFEPGRLLMPESVATFCALAALQAP